MATLATRALLTVLAVTCTVVAVTGLRTDRRCALARTDVLHGAVSAAAGRAVADRCQDPRDRAFAAALLARRGARPPALALARRMIRDSPQDYLGWLALGQLSGDEHALARARALDPRGVPAP
ncbi:MAG: hypothetical protein M3P44_16510 [Actinomycetota bacterium]|nr:hypothetical protein [Actinomycetota bacterium]